ncbi:hypothetical protein RMSM_03285 [Rhodopirellula maiorica SM1]|uniref:Ribonuclease HIII n=1 Tax=Rhodopirellula maiorica SM1 TaxID=1265738 RepID=M5RWN4_9BACT|nr:hypothetical protein [Rhodopirellula maiorica]EMI19797.1 hypothetical protein RMSM_03285 [Rhodopirellula maiorica SM1]
MLLIAVDEAGYGPKLGPLVVAATAWQLPDGTIAPDRSRASTDAGHSDAGIAAHFAPLSEPVLWGEHKLIVDDSKKLFQSRRHDPLAVLHAVVSVCKAWCGDSELKLKPWLKKIATADGAALRHPAWLRNLRSQPFTSRIDAQHVIDHWQKNGACLVQVATRIVTAEKFNRLIDRGFNKSDLLSDTSLRLIADVIDQQRGESVGSLTGEPPSNIVVYCDRHGGRQFYGAVLQHIWPDASLRIVQESRRESIYQLVLDHCTIQIRFTVKGDSFPPVAMSSIHAKYLRELCMNAFNGYFQKHASNGQILRPTAGYPVDAERFLGDAAETIQRLQIDPSRLIRSR